VILDCHAWDTRHASRCTGGGARLVSEIGSFFWRVRLGLRRGHGDAWAGSAAGVRACEAGAVIPLPDGATGLRTEELRNAWYGEKGGNGGADGRKQWHPQLLFPTGDERAPQTETV
jgi:hypothetical protein